MSSLPQKRHFASKRALTERVRKEDFLPQARQRNS
jgi:hypothetical protein